MKAQGLAPVSRWVAVTFACALCAAPSAADDAVDAPALYSKHCASCHGPNRLGGVGPALLPENLRRSSRKRAAQAISSGLAATQMPAFGGRMSDEQIEALVAHIFTPLAEVPRWGRAEIESTRVIHHSFDPNAEPRHVADPMNLFLVVESGDHHVTVLDGDALEPIHRFKSRYALHGGPKFSPDGRYSFLASRDGWVSKFDLHTLRTVSEVRAGINTRNLAVSADGRYVMVANYLPHTLVLLSAEDLSVLKVIVVDDGHGNTSRVSAVYDAAPRQSFIAALKDLTEVWEIQYADEPVYFGRVHDYRVEGPPKISERFPIRRIRLDDYLDDFFFDPAYENLIGAARNARNGQVVNLLVGRKIADIDLTGLPHLGSGISWERGNSAVIATPNLKKAEITVIEMGSWKVIERISTLGPGFFMRSHERSRYAWADVFFGEHRDAVHVIDKSTLEVAATLRPAPGKTAAHVEFTRDGRYALLSVWDMDGALVIYDAETLKEVKRLPMVKPSGKYNVWNKITRERGTSH